MNDLFMDWKKEAQEYNERMKPIHEAMIKERQEQDEQHKRMYQSICTHQIDEQSTLVQNEDGTWTCTMCGSKFIEITEQEERDINRYCIDEGRKVVDAMARLLTKNSTSRICIKHENKILLNTDRSSIKIDKNKPQIRRHICIRVQDNEERYRVGNKIHEQLVGNQDYIESRIVLNIETDYEVNVWIYDNSESDPEIKI